MFDGKAPTAGVYTLGCRLNQYESTAIEEALSGRGFIVLPFSEKCDVYIINTCAVTAESEKKSRKTIRRAKKENPDAFVIVTGCASQIHSDAIKRIPGVSYVCGNRNKLSVVDAAEDLIRKGRVGRSVVIADVEASPMEKMNITRSDRTRAYVKIEDGCDNHCTYCIIKTARGGVVSRRAEEIIAEIKTLAATGYREVVLTGVETASYGKDFTDGYSLSSLIKDVSEKTEIERIRLGSLEPSVLRTEFVDTLSENPKFMPSFHLSLQSGSNSVLASMKRKYNRETILKNAEYIKSKISDATFTCDIITGFPGETERDFIDTVDIAERIGFLHMHVFPFSKREGTPAAEMANQVDEKVKNERTESLIALDAVLRERNIRSFFGKNFSVLFETEENGIYFGHAPNMTEVFVKSENDLCSLVRTVRIVGYEDGKAVGILTEA